MTTSHHHETGCMVSTLRPGSCPQPSSLVRSSALDSLACAAAGCHTILVRKGILLVLLLITMNFRSVTDPRLSRAIQSMTISIFQQLLQDLVQSFLSCYDRYVHAQMLH